MSTTVNYSNTSNKEEAYAAVKSAITPELIAKFQVKADLDYTDDYISAKGKGFELKIGFSESACEITCDLSFMLKPLKGKILEGVEKQLKRVV